ncbi:MAG: PIG-L family deacetylase, partial [Candidatus Tectomicrobia bacterium]|nr:PIG-L family deacetylase [Candidatus Tectomicrobia bacterium]
MNHTQMIDMTDIQNQHHDCQSSSRVVFIGGLDDGRMVVEALNHDQRVNLVGSFVLDAVKGEQISGFRSFDDLVCPSLLHRMDHIKNFAEDIEALQPDVIFVVGFSQIIPKAILAIPPLGVIGFHSAVLPDRRGNAPLIWAIIDGLKETGVTMFYMEEGIDTGDIIATETFPIAEGDGAADVLRKANEATLSLVKDYLDAVLDGTAPRLKQPCDAGIYTRKRNPADGEINWSKPAHEIVNLIRALGAPYPMAHSFGGDGIPILIEKARIAPVDALPTPRYLPQDPFRQRSLCIVAHPDDEVLGIGGTLALHAEAGGEVIVMILSEGEAEKLADTPTCQIRRDCARKAIKYLGASDILFSDFPDQRLETVPFIDIVKVIEAAIETYQPSVVYTHHAGDANTDHQVVFKAAYAACRPMTPLGAFVQRFLTFETPSSTDQAPQIGNYPFNPTTFIDVEPVWDKKIQALQCYPSEMMGGRHPRSFAYIEAL